MIAKYGIEFYERQLKIHRNWNNKNQEWYNEYHKKRRKNGLTTIGTRINNLLSAYRASDKLKNRGECTLTKKDMIEMFNEGCYWCGETDWNKLGADRIDNTKPHTKENCVCSCWNCNDARQHNTTKISVLQYNKNGVFVAEYESLNEASRQTGIPSSNICNCCKGKVKTAGGSIWKYKN